MEKITICLEVPMLDEEFEILVPPDLRIKSVLQLLQAALKDLSEGHYVSSGKEILCRKDSDHVLDQGMCLSDYCIKNGEKIVLI